MLTVWSVCWGDKYDDYCVQRLQREVKKHLSIEHQFICITDRNIDGVACMPPINDLPGWWGKVNLFSPEVEQEHNLYLDLDVVITASLDDLVASHKGRHLAAPTNWAQSGHGGVQSSVMLWRANYNSRQIYDLFDPAIAYWPPRNEPGILWGDQEHITALRNADRVQVSPLNPDWIKSYKYHCRGREGLPAKTKVVVFHGEPKPENVGVSWFQW